MEDKQQLKTLSVVYAEDDEEMRESVARLLRRRVGELFVAENGKQGLEMVEQHHPRMIITDLEMPVMDGLEMIQRVREEFNGDTPIIVVTAYKDETHHTPLANGYVYKPVNVQELFNMMLQLTQPSARA